MKVMCSESSDSEIGTLLSLDQQLDSRLVGRKATVLAELKALGFPVPEGWVIPSTMIEQLINDPLPPDILGQINELSRQPLAVRSSGIDEDGEDASFAGMYQSILNVTGEQDVLAAVRSVAQSTDIALIRNYRGELGVSRDSETSIAVILQRMVPAEVAGVAFSANPVSGARDEVIINAVQGLGDQLLAGAADAETWTVRGNSARININREPVLSPEQAVRVATLARQVEETRGAPQDIEWAIFNDDLFLLQARPVTALPIEPDFAPIPPGAWSKETDHFTGLMSVAQGSIYIPEFKRATEAMFGELGALVERLQLIDRAGELYIQAVPLGERFGPPPPGWILGLLSRVVPQFRARIRTSRAALDRGIYEPKLQLWEARWKPELSARGDNLVRKSLDAMSDLELLEHAAQARQLMADGIQIHFQLAIPTSFSSYDLVVLCREFFGWNDSEALMLVARTAEASSAPSRALTQLAAEAGARTSVANALLDPDTTLLSLEEIDSEFARLLRDYLNQFGHRLIDNEISKPTLFERSDLVLQLIRDSLSQRRATSVDDDRQAQQRTLAENLLRMRSANDRRSFDETLDRASRMTALREEKVLYTMYLPGANIRYTLLEMGRRLAESRRIKRQDDIFFCSFEEALEVFRDEWRGSDLHSTIARRRAERAWVAANPGPLTLGPEYALPDPSWLPEPARYLVRATNWLFGGSSQGTGPSTSMQLQGVGASAGSYRGPVRVIKSQDDFHRLKPGDVLVCSITTSAWGFLFPVAGALVTDHGGSLSHPAIAAREHGLPAVVATGEATSRLTDGQIVIVDGSRGTVEVEADR